MIRSRQTVVARAVAALLAGGSLAPLVAHAADEDTRSASKLPQIVVQGTQELDAAQYLVGGDVEVITRDEIELRNFSSVREAVERIPGVQISSPGYRAFEYGTTFGEEISINGDAGVILMVDGRRTDNDASSFGGARSKSRTSLELLTSIENVERIEVIKGTGAAAYGAEAAGGIINVVTRRGGDRHETVANVGAGSWGQQKYSLTQSGPVLDESFRYFISGSYDAGDDTKYRDDDTGDTLTYLNTKYREKAASVRLDKAFTGNQEVSLSYTWGESKAHYPITAPDSDTLNLFYESQMPDSQLAPGYRNWFIYDAQLGSYSTDRVSDVDLKYTFGKQDGLSSFVRAYRNSHSFQTVDYADLFGTQLEDVTPELIELALTEEGTRRIETGDGAEVQLARKFGRHNVMGGVNYLDSEFESINISQNRHSFVNRDAYRAFLQDKMELTDRWSLSPGIIYSDFSTIEREAATGVVTERGSSSKTSFAAQTNYTFETIGDLYFSWQQIFRPKSNYDYDSETTVPLLDEEGQAWTIGLRRTLADRTFLSVFYQITDMDNAIGRYSIFDPNAVNNNAPTGRGAFVSRSVNATQKKKALNLSADHQFNANWAVSASYSWVKDDFAAKGFALNPEQGTNINALINRFRPTNTYQADVIFGMGRFSATLSTALYTGNDTRYFSDNQFTVIDLGMNYDLFAKTRLYLTLENITDESWQNKASAAYGPGAFPQRGRNFLAGVQQSF